MTIKKIKPHYYIDNNRSILETGISRRALLKAGVGAAGIIMAAPAIAWSAPDSSAAYPAQLTELLGLALQHEHGALVQYANHAGLLTYWIDQGLARSIQAIIADEVDHAVTLVNTLKSSGSEPTMAVWPPQTANSPSKVISQDIAAEQGAVNLYTRILEFDMDEPLRKNIEHIVDSEKSHKLIFENMLNKV
ncbi:MAG: ferritin-like domain-containing protein [Desulfonatronovibrio sp.]|nr:ferritin-like domain-containing protein [Desulfovibrionales bacterium]